MKLWKRNAVVAAIVLFVCVAVYLNWSYSQDDVDVSGSLSEDHSETSGKVLGEAALVSGGTTADTEQDTDQETLEPESGETTAASNYFDSARYTRQQARDNALSILQETAQDENADPEVRETLADSITALSSTTLLESQIENLVTAKGYADCVTFIGDNSISVVVSAQEDGLTATDVAKITDIVMGETEFTAGQIKIIEAN